MATMSTIILVVLALTFLAVYVKLFAVQHATKLGRLLYHPMYMRVNNDIIGENGEIYQLFANRQHEQIHALIAGKPKQKYKLFVGNTGMHLCVLLIPDAREEMSLDHLRQRRYPEELLGYRFELHFADRATRNYRVTRQFNYIPYLMSDVREVFEISHSVMSNPTEFEYVALKTRPVTYTLFRDDCVGFANKFINELVGSHITDREEKRRFRTPTENFMETLLRENAISGDSSWSKKLLLDVGTLLSHNSSQLSMLVMNLLLSASVAILVSLFVKYWM